MPVDLEENGVEIYHTILVNLQSKNIAMLIFINCDLKLSFNCMLHSTNMITLAWLCVMQKGEPSLHCMFCITRILVTITSDFFNVCMGVVFELINH